jgi:hypothetical protein
MYVFFFSTHFAQNIFISDKYLPSYTRGGGGSSGTTPRVIIQRNMVMSPAGPGIKIDCAGEGQQQFTVT